MYTDARMSHASVYIIYTSACLENHGALVSGPFILTSPSRSFYKALVKRTLGSNMQKQSWKRSESSGARSALSTGVPPEFVC